MHSEFNSCRLCALGSPTSWFSICRWETGYLHGAGTGAGTSGHGVAPTNIATNAGRLYLRVPLRGFSLLVARLGFTCFFPFKRNPLVASDRGRMLDPQVHTVKALSNLTVVDEGGWTHGSMWDSLPCFLFFFALTPAIAPAGLNAQATGCYVLLGSSFGVDGLSDLVHPCPLSFSDCTDGCGGTGQLQDTN